MNVRIRTIPESIVNILLERIASIGKEKSDNLETVQDAITTLSSTAEGVKDGRRRQALNKLDNAINAEQERLRRRIARLDGLRDRVRQEARVLSEDEARELVEA